MAETAREGFFNELSNGHYEPRQTGVRNTTCPRSRSQSAASTSIRRMRSNNGHGCADLEDSNDEAGVAAGNGVGEKDNFEVAWDGDDDPMCPRSMSLLHKWAIVIIVGTGSLCVTCASSIYTSTYDQMNPEFGISTIVGTLGLSTFVLGIALGPLLMGPLSEFFGRRPIYLVSWTMFLIWIIPSAVAKNAETMIVVRFFDGFAGSSFLSVAGGTVSDIFKKDAIQGPMTIISLSPFIVGPSLGPLLGGFVNSYTHWRWTYYFLLIWAAIMLALIVFFAPETYHPIKLREKARSLRKETGDERWRAPMEKSEKSIARTVGYSLLRPFQLLMFEPMCLALDIFSAILLGILYLFFGAFGVVFGNAYGFNLWQTGLAFLGIFTGMITASATSPVWRKVHSRLVAGNNGISEPEFHLPPAVAGAVLVPIGLFWFAWSSYPWVHWMVPIVGSGVFGMGTLLVFTGIFTFLVDAYPLYAASALAANAFTRCAFAAAFPLFGLQMYHKLGNQWASTLLAFLTVAMMPFPWLFFRYGKRLRENSKYAT
ncbi:major facilitator superfamily domain-containing protein [Truncatella angustata]|uniref:Major facilitator superfamily domain-containing protein n=1 Tax=Truncatella angustata TaxID=152316 RepID=A0A9P8REC2_9PEZI|nr:major facilitator superfamily domain-containing protein [Truncatella angustata]KAH6639908.1 major facilitator superfamily domain-containing protein [Truncatella angustata]